MSWSTSHPVPGCGTNIGGSVGVTSVGVKSSGGKSIGNVGSIGSIMMIGPPGMDHMDMMDQWKDLSLLAFPKQRKL